MEILSLAGGSLVSAAFDSLFEKLNEYLSDQLLHSKEAVRAQMESWKSLLPKITAVLHHAEENQVANQFVKLYLDDLRDLAYDMEHILEEFVIDAKRSELIVESEARPSKRQRIASIVKNFFIKAKPNQEINSMVNHLNAKLQQIENQMHASGLINLALKLEDKSHKVAVKRLPESSLLEDKVLGRDSDKDAILQRLLEDGGSLEQDFVIPIIGMGGLGKTTLARLIYNDKKLEGRFDLKAWVSVSDEFDVARITKAILEYVSGKTCDDQFGKLQEELNKMLFGRKFLLVLDDVWTKEYGQWDVLKRPFMSGAPGSKIIVTTRHKDVGTMMRGDDGVYNLELLQDDACLPLFTQHALGKENFDAHPHLQDVGEALVNRCKRLPLALKTLGGVLRGELRRDEWKRILNSEIWSSSEEKGGILPSLRLSYNHLPSHLKQCFAYCALFPKDYEFDKEELVLLWMAEGLLQQQSRGKKQMEEEIGYQYFQELLSRSFFQQSSRDESRFLMHDLINDLAVNVAGEIYCNLERNMGDENLEKNLEKARHLSFTPLLYEIPKRFRVLDKSTHLRTFLPLQQLNFNYFSYLPHMILHDFLPTLNRLRVLSLCCYHISELPDSFENLKHIRYIDLSCTNIKCLPESVGSLLFLQTLLLHHCELTKLPMTIGNLIDLHHLDISYTSSLKEMPSGIGNLKNLLTLSKFIVGKASGMMRLSNLKNLLQLQGRLSILDLQNVLNVQDAREANLDKILGLEKLDLEWTTSNNDGDEIALQMHVLTYLKPHLNLNSLKISCYGGMNFPNWVCDPLLFFNLTSMELNSCRRCTSLPSLGLLPVLEKLIIGGMEAIEAVGSEFYGGPDSFPSLKELLFRGMLNWKEWTSPVGSEGEFPCLRRLGIKDCPKLLRQLPINLSSLKELDVSNCNAMLLKSMGDLTSLVDLRIFGISKLTCLPMSMSLPSLKTLYIASCYGVLLNSMIDLTSLAKLTIEAIAELTCLPKSFIRSLTALETLSIQNCNDLTCLWEEGAEIEQSLLPFNLKHLSLWSCGALESLPNAMMVQMDGSSSSNTSMLMLRMEKLDILGCNSLKSFPRGKLPITLKFLRIENCTRLESIPDADGNNNSSLQLEIKNLPRLYCSQGCHPLPAFLKKFEAGHNRFVVTGLPHVLSGRAAAELESFPERMLQLCTELQSIKICNCKILKSLPNLDCVSNLVDLSIWSCEVLESLPELGLYTPNLKRLTIEVCKKFKYLPNTMYQLKSLQTLEIIDCPGIESIPDGGLPPNLTDLLLSSCENLKSLPHTMHQLKSLPRLRMYKCPSIESIPEGGLPPNLTELNLLGCENLKSVPNTMYQLTSLQSLTIPGWALTMGFGQDFQNLTSLQHLSIAQKFPLDIVLPSSLTFLEIRNEENLEYIPGRIFQNLSSFQTLWISNCPKLRSLPREAFPPSLGGLYISNCPLLERQHFEVEEEYWTLTRSVPCVQIDKDSSVVCIHPSGIEKTLHELIHELHGAWTFKYIKSGEI